MKIPRRAVSVAAGLALVAGTVAVAGAVTAAPGGSTSPPVTVERHPGPATPARPAARPKAPSSATVTLVTGDRFRVDTNGDGTQSVSALDAGAADGATFSMFGFNGDKYVIPNAVAPYLSSTMDLRLFDVSYLVRAKLDDAHSKTVPVTVSGHSGSALPALSAASGTSTVSKKSARAFGTMLAKQWRDSRSGASDTPVGTLPGGGKLTLDRPDGAPALPVAPALAPAAKPGGAAPKAAPLSAKADSGAALPYHTLTVDPIGRDGKPATMVGVLQNVDDFTRGWVLVGLPGIQGASNFSVPEGKFNLDFAVMSGPGDDLTLQSSLVVKPEVSVTKDLTVPLDARQAKPYEATVDPAPTGYEQVDYLSMTRASVTGGAMRVQPYGFDSYFYYVAMRMLHGFGLANPLYVTPTEPVHTGSFDFAAQTELVQSTEGLNPGPRYALEFPNRGQIPSTLTHHVAKADLTTVHSTIHAGACSTCTQQTQLLANMFTPWSQSNITNGSTVPVGERTDYWYTSEPELTVWQAAMNGSDGTRRWDRRRHIHPGEVITEDWDRGPDVPSPAMPYQQEPKVGIGTGSVVVTDPWLGVCGACRQDDNAVLFLQPLGDANPGHYADTGGVSAADSSLRFSRNGTLALSSTANSDGGLRPYQVPLPMLSAAADYELDWAYHPNGNTEQRIDTDWTFRSAPGDAAANRADDEECPPDPARGCSFLPLLFVTYDLPLDAGSHAPAGGAYSFGFTVAGQQHSTQKGSAATVSVSYDDGASWSEPQAATGTGDGGFTTTVQHPELAGTNGYVSLRIAAHDADGNAVTQTIIRAYALS
ncbi:hypothetical protein AB0I55_22705 [Actinocatenispora sera]|uniref:hypothetical protein n=1 Tax=Actinocatenispora sera TaxID=390989 RepID=UPI003405C01E